MTAATPPPPSSDAAWNQPPPPAPPARPGSVTAAGITLIVISIITALFGVLLLLGAAIFAGAAGAIDPGEFPGGGGLVGAFAGAVAVFMVIVIGWAILQFVTGLNVMRGRNWARITGIVIAVIGIVLALAGMGGSDTGGIIINLAFVAAQGYVLYVLATTGDWFASTPG